MNKALTPLEALKQMSAYHLEMGVAVKDLPNYEIIEKALKRLEEIDNRSFINGIREEMPADIICKKLKALEIIKEKEVDVALLNNCNSVEEYNECLLKDYAYDTEAVEPHVLDKYEFDLLKGVLS